MDILIVVDEKDLCNLLTLICTRNKFTVSCAFSLLDAVVRLERFPTLMFLDNNLTDAVGLDVIREFKARSPYTKIAFIAASADLKIREQAIVRGADYVFAKPFQLQSVREILSKMQDRRTRADPLL